MTARAFNCVELFQEVCALFTRKLLIVTGVVALLFAGACALHGQPADGQQEGDFFDRLDANHDGKIDADEFKGPEEAFTRMDKNGDGSITRDELRGGQRGGFAPAQGGPQGLRGDMDPAARWQQMLERSDANNDGKISAEEFKGPEEVLKFLDANNDGVITEEEALAAGNRRGAGQQMDPAERWQRLIDNCDANKDGKISAEEWPARPEMFDRLDRDGDGQLVQDELPQGRGQQDPGGGRLDPAQFLARNDANGDGKISREEWPLGPEAFDRLDEDGDGMLTETELQKMAAERPQRQDPARALIQVMDKNGDGQVSEEEWSNFFEATDVNTDGLMSHEELFGAIRDALRPAQPPPPADAPAPPAEGF